MESEADKQYAALRLTHVPDALLEEESGKLVFLLALLDNLKAAGHRSLVFSQSRKMLDIIERILKNKVSSGQQFISSKYNCGNP